jgi:hypothetical protein
MSTHIAGQVPLAGHGKVGQAWKLWIAGAAIGALTFVGFYLAITRWQESWEFALILFGGLVGPAVAAAFGYFWCLPEVLGGICRDRERTLLQKWSDFALLCSFFGILVVEGSYVQVIREVFQYISLPRTLAVLIPGPWVLAACVAASKEYLGWTTPSTVSGRRSGWRGRVRSGMEWCGGLTVKLLTTKGALVAGAALLLTSLVLVQSRDIFGPEFKGYEIAAGANVGTHFGIPFVLDWTQLGSYLLGILLAVLALAGVLIKGTGRRIRESKMLAALAGILCLLEVTKLAVIWPLGKTATPFVMLWLILWLVPIILWLMATRGDGEGRDRTRVGIMVFYLPLFLLWLGFLPFVAYLGVGYGAFVAGMLLLWWGFVQGSGQRAKELS